VLLRNAQEFPDVLQHRRRPRGFWTVATRPSRSTRACRCRSRLRRPAAMSSGLLGNSLGHVFALSVV
jgi:hypothetical protein